jgi:spore germination cell wall hydrolase CwlJ-like protein
MAQAWWQIGRRKRGAGIVALLALLCLGYSAQAAIRAIIAHPVPIVATEPEPSGFDAQDHFPGAAYFYAAVDDAAPAAGTTGTADLSALAIPANAAATTPDATIHPAQPFSMRLASPVDRVRALECLTAAIYYEAATEPEDGQRAVAQVILNRVRHPAFPSTVCGVIYQGSERAGCQFSYACDGAMARKPEPALWRRAMGIAADALAGRVFGPVGTATHYHTYAVRPAWNRQMVMTAAIGAHFFHRWQGYWGTPAAFTQVYRGGEPEPGPHPRLTPIVPTPLPGGMPVLAAATSTPSMPAPAPARTQLGAIQPDYAQTSTLLPRYAVPAAEADSQILDKWRDSGKPLR